MTALKGGVSDAQNQAILDSLNGPVPAAAQTLAAHLVDTYPRASVLLYGSGISALADATQADVLYDFYVIVPCYRSAFPNGLLRFAARWLPPNVFYCELHDQGQMLRCKYAVLSQAHFAELVGKTTFHSYFWARFAQPCRMVSGPDVGAVAAIVATAIATFLSRAAPLAPAGSDVAGLWQAGLSASYGAELRAEQPGRVQTLLKAYGDWPDRVTDPVLLDMAGRGQRRARALWRLRAVQGGLLSVLRLTKGVFTFEGGVDYIAWKISRHAGFTLPVRAWERRWPLLALPTLSWRYYRLKAKNS